MVNEWQLMFKAPRPDGFPVYFLYRDRNLSPVTLSNSIRQDPPLKQKGQSEAANMSRSDSARITFSMMFLSL